MTTATPPASTGRSRKRWRRFFVTLALLIALLSWSGPRLFYYCWINSRGSVPKRQTDFDQLARVLPSSDAKLAFVHKGLPHQMWASRELWRDLFTTANRSIGGYRFYTTPIAASDELRRALTTAMRTPALYEPYGGPKHCGGYHPDYCFEWHSHQGTVYGLLCTGCHEVIIIGGGTELHCDLISAPAKDLEKLLSELK